MEVTLEKSKLLKTSIDVISNIIDEANITLTKEGLRLKAIDPAHVAFVNLHIKTDAFSKYDIEEKLTIGIDLDIFNTILKRASATDEMTLSIKDETELNLKITNYNSTRNFGISLLDISKEDIKIPNLEYSAEIELSPNVLIEAIKDAEIVNDNIIFKADEENLYFKAEGDLGNVEVKVDKKNAIDYVLKNLCESKYSIEYLKDMIKASDIARTVKISFGIDVPLKLEFISPELNLMFLIAPQVEESK